MLSSIIYVLSKQRFSFINKKENTIKYTLLAFNVIVPRYFCKYDNKRKLTYQC